MLEPAWSFQKLTVRSKKIIKCPNLFLREGKNNNNKIKKQILAVPARSFTVIGAKSHINVKNSVFELNRTMVNSES